MAGHILLAEDDKALSALMQDFFRAAGVAVTPAYDGEQALVLAQAQPFDLLVLDDLGTERQSSFALELVFEIVDERVKSPLPLIVSTNLTQRELYEQKDVNYARIYDRITSVCAPVVLNGTSRRKAEGAERSQWLNGVLFGGK